MIIPLFPVIYTSMVFHSAPTLSKVSYFFFPEKFTAHSLTHFLRFFIFSFFRVKKTFFFFTEKFTLRLTHSFFQKAEKKKTALEKKNTIFTHSLDFSRKVVKNELFQGNKKIRYLCSPKSIFFGGATIKIKLNKELYFHKICYF